MQQRWIIWKNSDKEDVDKLVTNVLGMIDMQRQDDCCNLTDHRGLPIIHIKSIPTYQRQETRNRCGITIYIIVKGSI